MKCSATIYATLLFFTSLASQNVSAGLINRGNGMIYDSTLNITWLQDMNYAKTSGYSSTGFMTWSEATIWADQLTFGGFSDWRLPSAKPSSPEALCWSEEGDCDLGYNNTRGELSHLFYVDLQNYADPSVGSYPQPVPPGLKNVEFIDELSGEVISFMNMENKPYWLMESVDSLQRDAFAFYNQFGSQVTNYKEIFMFAAGVRDGDVITASVPEPSAFALLAAGIAGLISAHLRISRRAS